VRTVEVPTEAEATDDETSGTPVASNNGVRVITVVPGGAGATADSTPDSATAAPITVTPTVDVETVQRRRVFAYCDDEDYDIPPPVFLREGDFINIYWAWFASTEQQVQDHIVNVNFELKVNGEDLEVLDDYHDEIQQQGRVHVVYWDVPFGPLTPGQYEITYVATWEKAIFDGSHNYGPGTEIPFEQESCTFTVPER
jgi:hypothetical protein